MPARSKAKTAPQVFNTAADQAAFALDCRDEDHFPYGLALNPAEGDLNLVHAWLRTTSWNWDGCGGRTDLHEVFATLWAAVLRANGVASAQLFDMGGWCPGEIYLRTLIFRQPFNGFLRSGDPQFDRLRAHTALAAHQLGQALSLADFKDEEPAWEEESLPWLDAVRDHLGGPPKHELFVERWNPRYRYYRAGSRLTLLEVPPDCAARLRLAFRFYEPAVFQHNQRLIISAGGLHNAVALSAIRRAASLLQVIDNSPYAQFTGGQAQWHDEGLLVVPLEHHCVLVGLTAVVIVHTDCGYEAFRRTRDAWDLPARRAAEVFGQSGSFVWSSALNSARFEDLAEALLTVEPAVARVRSAGPHTDRDQGRDLICDWVRIADAKAEPPKLRTDLILAQVKHRGRTIGKSDVQDVRDTIERHNAAGFLLIGDQAFSGDLVNYLETLRQRGQSIEWWDRKQIEERLRSNLSIAARFPDVVRYVPPADIQPGV